MPFKLGPIQRVRTAFHVLRTGDYQPANAYLRGYRYGLDNGIDLAWQEFQRCFGDIGPVPQVPAESVCRPSMNPDPLLASTGKPPSTPSGGRMGTHGTPPPKDTPAPAPGPSGDGVPTTVTKPGDGTHKKPNG